MVAPAFRVRGTGATNAPEKRIQKWHGPQLNTDGKLETREALAEFLRGPGDSPNPGLCKIANMIAASAKSEATR